MKVLVQRSNVASCQVAGKTTGKIKEGLVLFVGFTAGDDLEKIKANKSFFESKSRT